MDRRTRGPGNQGPRTRGPKDLQLLQETEMQAICADAEVQAHGYVVTLSMQVSFAQLD